jgi:tetratricopeptide (TPR) repeat protein
MAKKKPAPKPASPSPAPAKPQPKAAPAAVRAGAESRRIHWILATLLMAVTLGIYSNTFEHRFVLDDHGIIKNNKITKAPVSWENTKTIFSTPLRKGDFSDLENSLYRPFTKFLFNIEWNAFNGNTDPFSAAHRFHVVNVLLYGLCVILIFFIFYDITKKKWIIPFLIALLFAVHPIHVEVVANVKSGDEVLSLLGILIALRCLQLYLSVNKMHWLILAVLGFLMGSFSKESTVVAVAIFPLFLYFFTNASLKKNAILSSVMLACSLFFLFARHQSLSGYPPSSKLSALDNYLVLCDPAEQKFLPLDLQQKYANSSRFASAVNTLGDYVKTFIYPHPLSCDYSFSSLEPVGFANGGFLISFLAFVGMFVFAVWRWKQKNPVGFGFLWFFISMSITSNVFFLIGTSFGERLFFVPSLGLCVALVFALAHYLHKKEEAPGMGLMPAFQTSPLLFGIVLLVSVLYSAKTISRNNDWKSDYKLFSRDIEYFPNSTHLLFYMGNHLSGNERMEVLKDELKRINEKEGREVYTEKMIADSAAKESARSIFYLTKSMSIYPALPSDGYNQLGKAYFNFSEGIKTTGNTPEYFRYLDSANKYYKRAYSEDSTNGIFINNLGTVLYNKGMRLIQQNEMQPGIDLLMQSFPYFVKAHSRDTTESDFMNNIGCIYGTTNRPDSAIIWFEKALAKDSMDLTSIQFLDITWRNKGNVQMADYYKAMADRVRMRKQQEIRQ